MIKKLNLYYCKNFVQIFLEKYIESLQLKKNKVYHEFFAAGDIFNSTYKIIKNDDTQVVTNIKSWGNKKNQFSNRTFK